MPTDFIVIIISLKKGIEETIFRMNSSRHSKALKGLADRRSQMARDEARHHINVVLQHDIKIFYH